MDIKISVQNELSEICQPTKIAFCKLEFIGYDGLIKINKSNAPKISKT